MENTGMTTLGQVAEKVNDMAINHHDHLVPVSAITFDSINTICISGEPHHLRQQAARQISQRIGVPYNYLQKCDEDVQAFNLNHWIEKEAKTRSELFFRFAQDDVRAVFTPRYKATDNHELLDHIMDMGYSEKTLVQAHLDSEFMSVSIPDGRNTFDVDGKGDMITPGISISNSEVGLSAVTLAAYMYRLCCSNAAIMATTTARISKKHISTTVLQSLPDMMKSATDKLAVMREQFEISLDTKVDDPSSTIMSLCRSLQLQEVEREAVAWGYEFERSDPESMFGVIQGFTRGVQYPQLSAFQMNKLEKAGGQILSMVRPENTRMAA